MNCPAKTDPIVSDGHNQNPNDLAGDLTTNSDLGRIANARGLRQHRLSDPKTQDSLECIADDNHATDEKSTPLGGASDGKTKGDTHIELYPLPSASTAPVQRRPKTWFAKTLNVARTYMKFVGPGMMISVAYIDPGNYATDVEAGATYEFKLLFIILLSNIFAIFLQSLCIKLGTVTGLSVSQMIRAHWPPWLNYCWFFLSAAAIEATDVAEVIGTAIALNLLSNGKIPLIAGCAMCPGDVFFIVVLYRSSTTSIRARRVFEFFVALLVIGVAVSFGIQLSYLQDTTPREVFLGFVPSPVLVEQMGLYLSCGIVGATVMPHSLILGSGLVQNRLQDFDKRNGLLIPTEEDHENAKAEPYRPSLRAIRNCIWYSIADNCVSLFTFALFVNSSILIVAGASLHSINGAADASLFGIYDLLQNTLGLPVATMFAVALLLSGISAGIVVTMAGQVAYEGHLDRRMKPWKLRLIIRAISVPISMAVAGTLGAHGLNTALVGSQVTLCVLLPCISLPLVWFTCQSKYMKVSTDAQGRRWTAVNVVPGANAIFQDTPPQNQTESPVDATRDASVGSEPSTVNMRNNYVTSFFVIVIWLVISMMNIAMLVLIATGKA